MRAWDFSGPPPCSAGLGVLQLWDSSGVPTRDVAPSLGGCKDVGPYFKGWIFNSP